MKLAALVTAYVTYKRALGHRFRQERATLQAFCRHVGDVRVSDITTDRIRVFITGAHTSGATAARKHRVLAGLSRYGYPRHQVLVLPAAPPPRPSSFVPYIYSEEDLKRLLEAAARVCSARSFIDADVCARCSWSSMGRGSVSVKRWR
jgi:hypothetical protein